MAVDVFFRIGDKIKGESKDAGKDSQNKPLKDQMDILAWSWSLSQSGTAQAGTGAGSGKVSVHDLTLTKYVDLASNDLITAVCKGTHFDKALLTVRKAGDTPMIYYTIEFERVLISNYSISGGGDSQDRMTENVSINFAKFKISYTLQNDNGTPGGTTSAGWDIPTSKPA
jgi:type VI secretion system secreted protein Hcp